MKVREIFSRRIIVILSVSLLLAVISVLSVNLFGSSGPVTEVMSVATRPIRAVASTVARAFGDIFRANYEFERLQAENDDLRRQIAIMESNYRQSQDVMAENELLRAQLGFQSRYGGYEQEMASFTGWGGDNWSSTFTINIGSANSNISPGNCVTTELGALVGQVYDVGATSSTVITILDTRFQVSAFVGTTDTREEQSIPVVAKGDFTYMSGGMLVLTDIDERLIVRQTDNAVTSGRGGIFPPYLSIGTVQSVERNPSGIGYFAVVSPTVNFDTLSTVFVITNFEEADTE